MATSPRDESNQLAANTKPQIKRTTCDVCRERKVRCDRNKPECLRCRRSGYKCTYPSENNNTAKLTKALQELNNRLRQAETIIQTSSSSPRVKEDNTRRDSPQILVPNSTTGFLNPLPDDLNFSDSNMDDLIPSWDKLAASDFDAVFGPLEDVIQSPDLKKNEPASNKELGEIEQMDLQWDSALGLPNSSAIASRSSPNIIENIQLYGKTSEDLYQKYFSVTQRHLPLVDHEKFMQFTVPSITNQAQALKYAICMAGANVIKDSRHEKQFYTAARYYMEQAELEVQGSDFFSMEAAQALVLITRYEMMHVRSSRALITLSRLDVLISIFQRRIDESTSGQGLSDVPSMDYGSHSDIKRIFLIAFSLKYRNITAAQIHDHADSYLACMQSPGSIGTYALHRQTSIFDRITPSKAETLDRFSMFMLCCRITVDADRHRRDTATDAAGPTVEYNYCHVHDRIDQEIEIIVSHLSCTHLSTGSLDNEVSVLAMIIVLGARLQLYNTAILHSGMAGFLRPVVDECLQQNVSTAKDISDIILQAQVLDSTRVAVYREASFYIMPPLALAVEAHMRLAQASASKISGTVNDGDVQHYLSPETRESLGALYIAMEACKDETDKYANLLNECQVFLGASRSGKRLRTEFTNLARRTASSSE